METIIENEKVGPRFAMTTSTFKTALKLSQVQ